MAYKEKEKNIVLARTKKNIFKRGVRKSKSLIDLRELVVKS